MLSNKYRFGGRSTGQPSVWLSAVVLCGAIVSGQITNAQAPRDGVVASGSATIAQSASQTTVQQSSNRAVIDWKSFDVGRDHTVRFDQPDRSSATLNRVNSVRASVIEGAIEAPGTVVIQNTAGVLFTGSARIDTGGLVASSQIVDPESFMNSGAFRIGGGEQPGAAVRNDGTITIGDAGLAALVGTRAENAGIIEVDMGTVVLASGETTTIDLAGDGVFQVAVAGNSEAGRTANSGIINAAGGRVVLTAGGAAGLLDTVINTSGVIRATSGTGSGGSIELTGRGGGQVAVSGTVESRGMEKGGKIAITGETVQLAKGARVDANGLNDGGTIHIGGEYRGGGQLRRATQTVLNMGSIVEAEGGTGAGGTVVVWADDSTWIDGLISTSGGAQGGFVETSGKYNLGIGNAARVLSGSGGLWLLDPRNVVIVGNSTNNVSAGVNTPPSGVGDYRIRAASIVSTLNSGSDVTITTTQPASTDDGNITVAANLRWNGSGSLTLDADNAIVVNRNIRSDGAGNLTLNALGEVDVNQNVQTRGTGDIQISAGADVRFDRPVYSTGDGDVTVTAGDAILISRNTTMNGSGNLTLNAGGDVVVNSTVQTRGAGNIDITAGADIRFDRPVNTTSTGNVTARADGSIQVNRAMQATGSGDMTLIAQDSLDVNQRLRTTRAGDLTLRAQNDITLNNNVFASQDGNISITSAGGDILMGGSNGHQRLSTNRGDLTIDANAGSVIFERTNTRTRNTQVYSNQGDIDVTAGIEIAVKGGERNRQFTRIGRIGDSADITLTAPKVSVLAGDTVPQGFAQIIAGSGGSIRIDADELAVESGSTNALASIQARNGASLTLNAARQNWDGLVRATGDVELTGSIDASVRPRFDLDTGANFALNTSNGAGHFDTSGVPLVVTTRNGTIDVGGSVKAPQITLETDTGVTLSSGASIRATGTGNALVIAAGDRFTNNAGAGALQTTAVSARWLLYMNDFDGLEGTSPASGNFDLYNRPYSTTPPASLNSFAGDRVVYGEQPDLVVAANATTKTYGDDLTALLTYRLTGLRTGDSEDTALTAPVALSSAGTGADAPVLGSPYAINVTATTSSQGYNVITNDATLTIDPAPLMITANDASRLVDTPNPTLTAAIDGFVLSETIADLSGGLSLTTPATAASAAGSYAITPSGVSSTNYAIRFVNGTLTVISNAPAVPEDIAAIDQNEGGADAQRRSGLRAAPLTLGDAAFRTTERDTGLATADPFSLNYSLGEVVTFQRVGTNDAEGFVPAAGGLEDEPRQDCGASVNLGATERAGCVSVVVGENYWNRP